MHVVVSLGNALHVGNKSCLYEFTELNFLSVGSQLPPRTLNILIEEEKKAKSSANCLCVWSVSLGNLVNDPTCCKECPAERPCNHLTFILALVNAIIKFAMHVPGYTYIYQLTTEMRVCCRPSYLSR
jgi:hypothetical protein